MAAVERRFARFLVPAALVILAVLCRLAAFAEAPAIDNDELRYLVAAHHLSSGAGYSDWSGPETHVHPLHPWLTSLGGGPPGSLEARGRQVTLIASLLVLLPIAALARHLRDSRAALIVLLLAGIHPWLVRASPKVEPESLYAMLTASAICCLLPGGERKVTAPLWCLAGLLFGLAYLARPEGLLVGALAGAIAFARERTSGRGGLIGPSLLLIALFGVASPFLFFLRDVTGEWTITGKADHVFIAGQALAMTPDPLAARAEFWSMKRDWGGTLAYVRSHPGDLLLGAAKKGLRLAFWILPRALGPAGLLGCLAGAAALLRRRISPGRLLLVLSPCLVLPVMLFVLSSERVVGSTVPFILAGAAAGLSFLADRLAPRGRSARALAVGALLLAGAAGWGPALVRRCVSARPSGPALERQAAGLALRESGTAGRFLTNNPVLSFYAADPILLGPPGRYRFVLPEWSCADLVARMGDEDVPVAVLDSAGETWKVPAQDAACPLRLARGLAYRAGDREIRILVLERGEDRPDKPSLPGGTIP